MRISFWGSSDFSLEILKKLFDFHNQNKLELAYVITQPAKAVGRKKELKNNIIAEFCFANNIKVYMPDKLSEILATSSGALKGNNLTLKDLEADLSFVAAYGKIIKKEILNTAKYGFVNFHGSLLPKYRGAIPVQMTVLNQDAESAGVSIIKMDEGMDTGDIITAEKYPLINNMTAGVLMAKLAELSTSILEKQFNLIFNPDRWDLQKQNDSLATTCFIKDFTKENVEVTFFDNVLVVHGKVMAANPEPVAWVSIADKVYNLYRSSIINIPVELRSKGEINFVIDASKKRLFLEVFGGFIEILQIQPLGKNIMDAKSFINGYMTRKQENTKIKKLESWKL